MGGLLRTILKGKKHSAKTQREKARSKEGTAKSITQRHKDTKTQRIEDKKPRGRMKG
jgi:hypothetical protein